MKRFGRILVPNASSYTNVHVVKHRNRRQQTRAGQANMTAKMTEATSGEVVGAKDIGMIGVEEVGQVTHINVEVEAHHPIRRTKCPDAGER